MSDCDFQQAKKSAYRLLSVRPRSEHEIRRRLKQRGYSSAVCDDVCEALIAEKLLDDKAFARLWAESRNAHNPRSWWLVARELREKGIDEAIIDELKVCYGAGDDDRARARMLAAEKRRTMRDNDKQKIKRRIADLLKRRGFSASIIYDVIQEIE